MKSKLVLALFIFMGAFADVARAEHTRVTNPNAFTFELLGRGLFYSLNFDRVMNDEMAAGFGFGAVSTKTSADVDTGISATMIPVYFNYYFTKDQGSLYATAGATLISNSGDVKNSVAKVSNVEFSSDMVLPNFGVGYENRGDSGFLFRFTGYGVVADKLRPWFGFTFGYAF